MSYYWKLSCLVLHIVFFFVSLYYFLIEHQQYCMAGGYSRYALCEWSMSFCNILYDASGYLDFEGTHITLSEEDQVKLKK